MTDRQAQPVSIARRAAAGAGWIIGWRVMTRNIGLLSTLILVRLLQPSDFGLVALATGFIASVDALSAIGVQDALVRAETLNREMYDTGFALSILRGALTALVVALIAQPVGAFFADSRLCFVMLALSAGTLISGFENIGTIDFRRELAFRKEFEMQLWSRVIGTAATIAVAVAWRSYWALVAGILTYRLARLGQSYVMSSYRPGFTLAAWRRIIGFSLWTWAQTIVYQVKERADGIVIGRALGTTQVGFFSIGLELGSLPTTELVEPLGRALFAGFASLNNASQGLANMFLGSIGLGLLLILPAGAGISMVADPMVRLTLGADWLIAVPVVQVMAIGGTTAIFTHACANLLNAVGRPQVTFHIAIFSTVIKVLALVGLVPEFGLLGATAAILLASSAEVVLLLAVTLPRVGVSPAKLAACAFRPIAATAVMVLVLWQFGMAWTQAEGDTLSELVRDTASRCALGAACYAVALAAAWMAAGRPDGAERHALMMAGDCWKRLRQAF